jgi:HSP20 family protein
MTILATRRPLGAWPLGIQRFHDEMGRMFERFLDDFASNPGEVVGSCPVDVWEDDDHIYVEAELPGITRDEIDLTLERGLLTISGERKIDERPGADDLRERYFGRVYRCLTLPSAVDEKKVDATMKDGILRIVLDKAPEAKPHRIEVK